MTVNPWSNPPNQVDAVGGGDTQLVSTAEGPIDYYGTFGQKPAQSPVRVRWPYRVNYVSTQAQGGAICPPGMAGWSRLTTLGLYDQYGQAYQRAGINVADAILIQNPNQLGINNTNTANTNTNASGRWPDQYFVCSTGCPGAGQTVALQRWTWNGNTMSPMNLIDYRCNSITIDGN